MKKLTDIRINKTEILISAVITLVLAAVSFLTHTNEAVYPVVMALTELALLTFMSLYITYSVPEKDFSLGRA
jgi:uncharacterized membrane protein YozB (DUF420 family)